MGTRLDIELTSKRPDGTWTWRAAGAKLPKGSLDASLLYEGARVGDIVRAETQVGLDGVTISAVLPPPEPEPEPARIVPRPPEGRAEGGVTLVPAGRSGKGRARREAPSVARAREEERRGPGRPQRPGRTVREAERVDARPARRTPGPKDEAAGASKVGRTEDRRRLSVGHQHRRAFVGSLPPEQRPVAEALLRGGLPAVRQALAEQNAEAKAKGLPEVPAEPLLRLAEELLPKARAAEWRDRAEAVRRDPESVPLRDLRSVVIAAEQVARDDESRALAAELREALVRRLETMRNQWTSEISQLLEGGQLVRALRLSARPPEPTARLSAELAVALAERASAALDERTDPERWLAVLHAAAESAIRRNVHPVGLPKEAPERVLVEARALAGRVPGVAKLLGMDMPPPPGPLPPRRPARPGGPGAPKVARDAAPSSDGGEREARVVAGAVGERELRSEDAHEQVTVPAGPDAS